MKPLLEAGAYIVTLAVLGGALFMEGRHHAQLQAQVPITAKDLYRKLASSQVKLQIIDARTDVSEYEDTHIPGAIPVPGCNLDELDPDVRQRVYSFVPTIVVTQDGDTTAYQNVRKHFAQVRNLEGGMEAWSEASYPEDSGEWIPPRAGAGGGCL